MFHSLSKGRLLTSLALICANFSLAAWDDCDSSESNKAWDGYNSCQSSRMYVGAFGGGIFSNATKSSQMGTAFFQEDVGGPLAVFAKGHTKRSSTGFGGVQVGYELSHACRYDECSNWSIGTAGELEAYFFSHKKKGHFINPSERLPEHDFVNSFDMNMSVVLANAIFSINTPLLDTPILREFSPYVGGGIGAAHVCLRNARSVQVSPIERGINHFNSRRNDSSWAFAAQIKAGLRYNISESLHIFGEYRYLFIDSSNYILGSTVYSNHVPTSPWNVKVKNIQYNAFAIGLQYDL